jgi:putative tricarboxylic transport membrane protein
MSLSKREFLACGVAGAAGAALPAWAQPKALFETINMFVPAAPGGGWDGTARAIERAAKAAGLVGARLTEEAGVVVVPASGKIKTWNELVAALKGNPKAVSVAGGSAGGTDHLILGLMVKALGRNPREAAYVAFAGGGPANAAIIGGQVVAGISGYSEFEEQIKAGRMIPLATSGRTRIPGVNVPTMTELGMNLVMANWRGVFAPPGITNAQRDALINFISQVKDSAAWQQELVTRKWSDAFLTEIPFEREIRWDIERTEVVMKDLGLA